MTDKPTPTDAELKTMWQLHVADIGVIFYYNRAVLAKWGQPAGATKEVENLRKALVYAAFALHGTPQHMLAQGITLIDGDTVRMSRDGWTVEASVNPHRQTAHQSPKSQAADSVQDDAARWQWLADYLIGERTDLDEGIVACATIDALRQFADAARKQGEKHDR